MVRRTAARPATTDERALRAAAAAELVAAHHAAAAVERLARRLAGKADPGTDWREYVRPARELLRAALDGPRVP